MNYKNTLLGMLVLVMTVGNLTGQVTVTASISSDSILLGNTVVYAVEVDGSSIDNIDLDLPNTLEVVSGPNVSKSMTIVNGDVSQTSTYTYYLKPVDIGMQYIPPVTVHTEDGVLETVPLELHTYPNPDNIIQQPEQQSFNQNQFNFDFNDLFDQPLFEWGQQPEQPEQEVEEDVKPKRPLKRI